MNLYNGSSVFCPKCGESTYMYLSKENGSCKETVGGVELKTFIQDGVCKNCGRRLGRVTVEYLEIEDKELK